MRPYIGGTNHNSILELTFGYNGIGRLTGADNNGTHRWWRRRLLVGDDRYRPALRVGDGDADRLATPRRADRAGNWSVADPHASAHRQTPGRAAPVGWLADRQRQSCSASPAGIIHPYYTVAIAPPIAALVGIGVTMLWRTRAMMFSKIALAVTLAVTAGWNVDLLNRASSWHPELKYVVIGGRGDRDRCALRADVGVLPGRASRRRGDGGHARGGTDGLFIADGIGSPHGLLADGWSGFHRWFRRGRTRLRRRYSWRYPHRRRPGRWLRWGNASRHNAGRNHRWHNQRNDRDNHPVRRAGVAGRL